MALQYGYVQTRNRWHRVVIVNGNVLSQERCNLDDTAYRGKVRDTEPVDAKRCAHCFDEDEVVDDA